MELSLAPSSVSSLLLLVLSVAYIYHTTCRRRNQSPRLRLPPSPPGWPVIGHLHLLSGMPHHALAELSRAAHARAAAPPPPRHRAGSGDLLACAGARRPDHPRRRAVVAAAPPLRRGPVLRLLRRHVRAVGAVPPRGAADARLRAPLAAPRRGPRRRPRRRGPPPPRAPLPPRPARVCAARRPRRVLPPPRQRRLCRVAFGRRLRRGEVGGGIGRLAAVVEDVNELFGGFSAADCFPELEPVVSAVTGFRRRLHRSAADLRRLCDDIVDEHIITGKSQRVVPGGDRDEESFLVVLLRLQRSPDQLEVPLTVDNVKALVRDIFIGGTDATFTAPERVMAELVRHPAALNKAQEEVRRVVGGKGAVEERDLGELRYLRAAVKEALRLHPPVPLLVQRESAAACVLGGYDIPAGTRVLINAYAMRRDPEVWEDPLRYSPERFENGGGGGCEVDLRVPEEYRMLPFGGGRRGCPGYAFAMATVQLALASLLYHFEWELPAGVSAMDVNLDESFGLTTRKKEPLLVVVRNSEGYEFKGEELNEVQE